MAKQNGTMPKIDEDFMRELISQGVPGKQVGNKPDDVPQETQSETAQAEKPTSRKRKGGSGDYREKLMRIVTVIGGRKVTVSSYVENILTRHFEQYQDEINALYESNYQKPF